MLKTPELAMPRSRKVTTICNGMREVWFDYEEAKAYFLEMMMSTDRRSMTEQSASTFSSRTGWTSVRMKMNNDSRGLCGNAEPFAMPCADENAHSSF